MDSINTFRLAVDVANSKAATNEQNDMLNAEAINFTQLLFAESMACPDSAVATG
jgi:hypothetical protein